MANVVYNHFKTHILSGDIDLSTVPIYLMLVTSSYTFSHSHELQSQITNEISSAGYTAGGKLIPNTSVMVDSVDNEAVLSGNDITFSGLTATFDYGILWASGATLSTRYLIGQLDFGTQSLTASDFAITWNSEGILNLS